VGASPALTTPTAVIAGLAPAIQLFAKRDGCPGQARHDDECVVSKLGYITK
jgi:hypothetical protein